MSKSSGAVQIYDPDSAIRKTRTFVSLEAARFLLCFHLIAFSPRAVAPPSKFPLHLGRAFIPSSRRHLWSAPRVFSFAPFKSTEVVSHTVIITNGGTSEERRESESVDPSPGLEKQRQATLCSRGLRSSEDDDIPQVNLLVDAQGQLVYQKECRGAAVSSEPSLVDMKRKKN